MTVLVFIISFSLPSNCDVNYILERTCGELKLSNIKGLENNYSFYFYLEMVCLETNKKKLGNFIAILCSINV